MKLGTKEEKNGGHSCQDPGNHFQGPRQVIDCKNALQNWTFLTGRVNVS